jgi:DDE family transposase
VRADLDALLTAIYVLVDDFPPERSGPGAPPRITDAELVTLAIAQVFLGLPNDRQFLALADYRLRHLFPYLPKQPGYNKRLRRLVPELGRAINYLAFVSPSFCDGLRLLDSTPVPSGRSRETVRRSEFAGHAGYGYCRSHSAYFWGFRLYLLCASDGTPIAFELAPANAPEREVAEQMLDSVPLAGYTVVADKGFAGAEFERFMAEPQSAPTVACARLPGRVELQEERIVVASSEAGGLSADQDRAAGERHDPAGEVTLFASISTVPDQAPVRGEFGRSCCFRGLR